MTAIPGSWEEWDDAEFMAYVELHSRTERALFSKAQVLRLMNLAGIDPAIYINLAEWVPMHYDEARFAIEEAKRRTVLWDSLDPGILETVRWLVGHGFHTTDSGDGVSKPPERRVLDFPHVIMRVADPEKPASIVDAAHRLRDLLRARGLEVGPNTPDGMGIAIDASYDVGAGVATLLLQGVNDTVLGLDRHWMGSRCAIPTSLDTADYQIGDSEPCVMCTMHGCRADVVPGYHRDRDVYGPKL